MLHLHIYICIYMYTYMYMSICLCFCSDPASIPFKFLNRLPDGCCGGEGTPPETLKCLTPNPYS